LSCISLFDNLHRFLPFFSQGKNPMIQLFKMLARIICVLGFLGMAFIAHAQSNETNGTSTQAATRMLDTQVQAMQNRNASPKKRKHAKAAQTDNTLPTGTTPTSGPDAYITRESTSNTISPNVVNNLPIDVDVPGQSFVSSGPYIGIPLAFSGSNLIINSPNINEDVSLLNIRKAIKQRLRLLGRGEEVDHAHLLLSGIVEAQAIYKDPGEGPTSDDIDLTDAELDGYILGPSSWTSALFAMTYDNSIGSREGTLNSNSRVNNSRLFISKAFIVLGDFSRSPWYASMGQMYVPFGTYSTNMISSPLTKILGRTHERALVIGFQQQGADAVYGAGYMFRGDTYTGATERISNGGINLGYRFVYGNFSGNFGGGAIMNLADSSGMQFNGQSPPFFGGFAATNEFGGEQIAHRVPALNLRGIFSIGSHIDLLVEYIGAIPSFSESDLTYNSHGAKPAAVTFEAAYSFTAFERPSSIALGYGKTKDALALSLPQQRYSVVFNTSWWKDTLQSIEFRHDQNYAESSTATGTGTDVTELIQGAGKPDNTATAQFDIYF
jgi:hypothetical protein